MKKLRDNKFITLGAIIALLIGTFVYSYVGWENCSLNNLCNSNTFYSFYVPLYYGTLMLLTFFTFFLFLPFHYFKKWILYIFPLGFLISCVAVQDNLRPGGGMFEPPIHFLIYGLTIIFWIITLIFCAVLWWKGRTK